MSAPYSTYPAQERPFIQAQPGRGGNPGRGTGAKRGRKPKAAAGNATSAASSPRPPAQSPQPGSSQPTELQWHNVPASTLAASGMLSGGGSGANNGGGSTSEQVTLNSEDGTVLSLPGATATDGPAGDSTVPRPVGTVQPGADEDGEGDDEILPAMADDDYSAQLSFQSQSKDNLKVLMDNFSNAQYDRFEAYRRHALPKSAVRKVIQQSLGQQVSQPVAQIVAGFAKVFVGEIVEKARAVQERRGEQGPLSPDHLREAYRMYQQETGRVGAARPLRSKRLFVR
ncbi:TAFII28-domain-containing protein [Wolfiporia cocos MD-104 SS10]|uniref:Transcription initiation factor TFIID subunit 11 n=1 Tax=Wolfiporia cocos (strain MD-104) TaxID=742152 RepID=A0A2H3J4E4_WOLCO|nr:TAFII28-domain-containing protein [Wolfiporia cocos MD-104 SS10]